MYGDLDEFLKEVFKGDDVNIMNQLRRAKNGYKMKFGVQPELDLNNDYENDWDMKKQILSHQRVIAFLHNSHKL